MSDRTEILAAEVIEAFERLVRELLARRAGSHLIGSELDRMAVQLDLALRSGGEEREARSRALREQIDAMFDDAVEHAAVFRPGHAYCHRCRRATCEHSTPPSSRHVFASYAPTGSPRWIDFAQHCLDVRHPQVDRLYDQPPVLFSLVHSAAELHRGLLHAFDNGQYSLLGQLSAGFFSTPADAHEGRGIVALSIQVALSIPRQGRPRLGLNVLARAPGGQPLERLWDRHDDLPWRVPVRWAQRALATLGPTLERTRRDRMARHAELETRIGGILSGLGRRIERDNRARTRRTKHAQERHQSGTRPTRKAIEDARVATEAAFLYDERSAAIVILGERGRTHFFGPRGKLVSSVRYSRDAIARKVQLQRWRPASPDQRTELLRAIEAHAAAEGS